MKTISLIHYFFFLKSDSLIFVENKKYGKNDKFGERFVRKEDSSSFFFELKFF